MKRSGPIKRKVSLRDSYAKKFKAEKTKITNRKVVVKTKHGGTRSFYTQVRKKPLKKISKSRREKMKTYFAVSRDFLDRNPDCQICIVLREHGENIVVNASTETHHKFGRAGSLLADERGLVACCRNHREWPHDNPRLAREWGLLGGAAEWNTPIDNQLK